MSVLGIALYTLSGRSPLDDLENGLAAEILEEEARDAIWVNIFRNFSDREVAIHCMLC